MVVNPHVLKRAQIELDAVLGPPSPNDNDNCRMPNADDRTRLPYINALVKEVWRWNPAVPLGVCIVHVQVES